MALVLQLNYFYNLRLINPESKQKLIVMIWWSKWLLLKTLHQFHCLFTQPTCRTILQAWLKNQMLLLISLPTLCIKYLMGHLRSHQLTTLKKTLCHLLYLPLKQQVNILQQGKAQIFRNCSSWYFSC